MEDRRFLVAALDNDGAWSTPVRVRCPRCQDYSPPYGGADTTDGNGVPTGEAFLGDLMAWAASHVCGPALSPDAWVKAGEKARSVLSGFGTDLDLDPCVKAFAAALASVWDELRPASG